MNGLSNTNNSPFRGAGGLEIAVFNFQSAIIAANAGANRLELCANYNEGGTTVSYGMLKKIRDKISIPIFPIVRPRGGNFFYSADEFEIMKTDVALIKSLGFEGIVIGLLNEDNTVDVERTKRLAELAYPLEVTFHRAFDKTPDAFEALEKIINCGCQRILTSGQQPTAIEGKDLIQQLIKQADERIIIMPGGGVRSENIEVLKNETGAVEFHSAAIVKNNNLTIVDYKEVEKMKSIIQVEI